MVIFSQIPLIMTNNVNNVKGKVTKHEIAGTGICQEHFRANLEYHRD